MKKFNFNPNALTAGMALALGLVSGSANASTTTNQSSTAGTISNTAEATYSVDGVAQPKVTSNAVVVNTSEVANFTLVATQGASATDDKNEAQVATPGQATRFTNTLTNTGNLSDTYTLNITQNNEGTITTGNQDYQFTSPTAITYVIKNANGSTPTAAQLAAGQAQTGTVASGSSISLLPGQYAELSYNVTTPSTQVGGQSGVGTLTATSTRITSGGTLINENHAIVRLPVFAITKTATNTNINLNTANPSIDYSITVKNDGTATYAADAIGVLIQDKLPIGLSVDNGTPITVSSTDNTTTNGSAPQILTSGTQQIIAISGVDLKVGETMTITFKALVNKATVDKTKPLVNNADVYDNYGTTTPTAGDNPTSDIKDSTANSDPTNTHVPNDPAGTGTGGDSSTPVSFSDRALTLTGSTTAELPPTSATPATYTETITNTGNNPESGLTFTITNPSNTDNITPSNVVYTAPNGTKTTLTPNGSGVYTIPGSIGSGQTGTITYDVATTGAAVSSSETNTITLIPATVTGTTTPTVAPVTNTTNVEGLKLAKTQAIDANCDGTAEGTFVDTAISGTPGQCVVYRITATNSMTTKSLTNVVISDLASQWNAKATYVVGSGRDSASGTVTPPGTSVVSSSLTLAANGGTGYLQFAVKINGAN
ncbi:MAG TPA: hypothetical protein DDY26_09905 [Moraxellaceae bacterium]|nr:hypothetical protein [Moraxella sp.]HBI50102.1 hypothetical protein [Moraxellaceae bacterium]